MPTMTYTLSVTYASAPGEIDATAKRATLWIAENLDPRGNHDLAIHLRRGTGELLDAYDHHANDHD